MGEGLYRLPSHTGIRYQPGTLGGLAGRGMKLRGDDLTWHVVGDEIVVLDLYGSTYLSMNGTGRVLWERLGEPCTPKDLVDCLVDKYEVDVATADQDVKLFLDDLRSRGLLDE